MQIDIDKDRQELGMAAGRTAARGIREAIEKNGCANIILATGTSQFETLDHLTAGKDIKWGKVVMFHLDEYIGLSESHPASFRKYLHERFVSKVPRLKAAYFINGEASAEAECMRLSAIISSHPIDVALVGIGENGHLAFNDPPADFETDDPFLVVQLDQACRTQQLNEGWFRSLDEVPKQAISMSIKQILKSKQIICSVPDERKAMAVKNSLEQPVSEMVPASALQLHDNCTIFLDRYSSALLSNL